MSIVTRLVCDWPDCGAVKSDLCWWEDSIGEGPWNRTKDGRDWCRKHTRAEISALLDLQQARDAEVAR